MGTRHESSFRQVKPSVSPTVTISVTGSSVTTDLGCAATEFRIYNAGSGVAFLAFGVDNTVTTSVSTGMPLPPGAVEYFRPPVPPVSFAMTDYFLAACTQNAASATLYVTPGEGN